MGEEDQGAVFEKLETGLGDRAEAFGSHGVHGLSEGSVDGFAGGSGGFLVALRGFDVKHVVFSWGGGAPPFITSAPRPGRGLRP